MQDISYTILHHGFIENDDAWNFAVEKPGSIHEKHPQARWIRVPSFSVLFKHPDAGYILYDTGSSPGDEKDRRPKEISDYFPLHAQAEDFLDARLSSVGLKPDDVSMVIISHMH